MRHGDHEIRMLRFALHYQHPQGVAHALLQIEIPARGMPVAFSPLDAQGAVFGGDPGAAHAAGHPAVGPLGKIRRIYRNARRQRRHASQRQGQDQHQGQDLLHALHPSVFSSIVPDPAGNCNSFPEESPAGSALLIGNNRFSPFRAPPARPRGIVRKNRARHPPFCPCSPSAGNNFSLTERKI